MDATRNAARYLIYKERKIIKKASKFGCFFLDIFFTESVFYLSGNLFDVLFGRFRAN